MLYVSGAVHHRMCERIYNITWKQQTLNQKKKSTFCVLFFIFCTYKPNSVLLRATVIYLGCLLPNTSSDSPGKPGTILHSRKDLAVSLFNFNIYEDLSDCSDTPFFRPERHCSHLWDYPRWVLPTTLLYIFQYRCVRTFLPF